jgi:hypothetical protein
MAGVGAVDAFSESDGDQFRESRLAPPHFRIHLARKGNHLDTLILLNHFACDYLYHPIALALHV